MPSPRDILSSMCATVNGRRLSKLTTRVRVFLRQNKPILGILVLWFLFGFFAFAYGFKLSPIDALLSAFYLRVHENDSSVHFAFAYSMWGQAIVFGVIFGLLVQNALDCYNPERGVSAFCSFRTGRGCLRCGRRGVKSL